MEVKSPKPMPDLVMQLPNKVDVRLPADASERQKSLLESQGYIFEKDEKTGDLVAHKQVVVKGDED